MNSNTNSKINDVIQALKQGEYTLKEIVSEVCLQQICTEKPKLTKEQRKQLKLEKQREWYARNKEWHKIYNKKKALEKAQVVCEHTALTKDEMKKQKQGEAYSRWYQKNKEYHKIYRMKKNLTNKENDVLCQLVDKNDQPGNEPIDDEQPGSEE
jgi:hypothetical protein